MNSEEKTEASVAALTVADINQRLAMKPAAADQQKKLDVAREFVRKAQARRRTYLSFNGRTPTGAVYLLGAEKKSIPLGTQVVADVDTAERGFVQWEDGEALDEAMGPLLDGFTPDPSKYPEEEGWEETYRIRLSPMGQPHATWTFSTRTAGGRKAVEDVIAAWSDKNDFTKMPIVELRIGAHDTKKYKNIPKPNFPVVGWFEVKEGLDRPADPVPQISGPEHGGNGAEAVVEVPSDKDEGRGGITIDAAKLRIKNRSRG
jgi:hypothetical protein